MPSESMIREVAFKVVAAYLIKFKTFDMNIRGGPEVTAIKTYGLREPDSLITCQIIEYRRNYIVMRVSEMGRVHSSRQALKIRDELYDRLADKLGKKNLSSR